MPDILVVLGAVFMWLFAFLAFLSLADMILKGVSTRSDIMGIFMVTIILIIFAGTLTCWLYVAERGVEYADPTYHLIVSKDNGDGTMANYAWIENTAFYVNNVISGTVKDGYVLERRDYKTRHRCWMWLWIPQVKYSLAKADTVPEGKIENGFPGNK